MSEVPRSKSIAEDAVKPAARIREVLRVDRSRGRRLFIRSSETDETWLEELSDRFRAPTNGGIDKAPRFMLRPNGKPKPDSEQYPFLFFRARRRSGLRWIGDRLRRSVPRGVRARSFLFRVSSSAPR